MDQRTKRPTANDRRSTVKRPTSRPSSTAWVLGDLYADDTDLLYTPEAEADQDPAETEEDPES
ncbi:MAG: hypothetical protein K9J06_08400 [Flavobacteriales bacterium]|nr:hypothetical protein [Flavobacteriales bacterium]